MIDPRSGRPTSATIAFTLAFTDTEAATAQQVTNELVTLFLNENLRERTRQVTSTEEFLKTEAEQLNKELLALEQRMADFKTANEGSLPESYQFNLATLERTRGEFSDVQPAYSGVARAVRSSWPEVWPSLAPPLRLNWPRVKLCLARLIGLKHCSPSTGARLLSIRIAIRTWSVLEREISALQAELGTGTDVDGPAPSTARTAAAPVGLADEIQGRPSGYSKHQNT